MKNIFKLLFIVFMIVGITVFSVAATDVVETLPEIPTDGDIWDGTTLQPSVLTQKDGVFFYQISSCEELAYIAEEQGEWLSYNYVLANNLILNDTIISCDEQGQCINAERLLEWTPIDGFDGIFDGNGFTISGVYIEEENRDGVGVFGLIYATAIKNLTVVNSYIYGNNNVGGIIGEYDIAWNSDFIFTNCTFSGVVRAHNRTAGGLLGCSGGGQGFSNLINYGTIYADGWAGGITGDAYRLDNCVNYGDVSYLQGSNNSGEWFGGIAGTGASYTNCVNYGTVTGETCVGGIYGIEGGGTHRVTCCENKGLVKGEDSVGGIAGVSGDDGIEFCKNSGTVQGKNNVGGIVGYRRIGFYPKTYTVENVYNVGTVSGENYVGGIIGFAVDNTYLNSAYNIGAVNATGIAGALLCADNYMWGKTSVNDCFYEKEKTPTLYGCGYSGVNCDSGGIQAKTEEELKTKSTYPNEYSSDGYYYGWPFQKNYGWKFDKNINNGYPCFFWETAVVIGDLNLDGSVDIFDAVLLFQHSMLPDLYPIEYVGSVDFNGDSVVDIADAVLLFQHSMLPDLYPID